jgi:hypothetical protein
VAGFSGRRGDGGNLAAPRSGYFDWPHGEEVALEWLRTEDGRGREVYFCAHLLTARRRVKGNAAPLLALYVDGDGAKPGPGTPTPSAVVESSPGREQYYWRLARPVAPEVGEALNRRLALAMGGDRSGWDLTQLLRPPGTRNHKYPDAPLVALRERRRGAAHDPDELDRVLPPVPEEQPREAGHAHRPENVGASPDLSRLSRKMRDLILHGNNGDYETRSDADFAACIAMFGAGYERAQVWAAMTDPANRISEKFLEKGRGGERYMALTIGKARALAERAGALVDRISIHLPFLGKMRGRLSVETVVDMLENARRRIVDQGRYDDGVARLYRTIEMWHQWRLQARSVSTEKIEWDKLDEKAQKRFLRAAGLRELPQVLALHHARLLDGILSGTEVEDEAVLRDLLQKRNRSILAHGLEPIGKDAAFRFLGYVDEMVEAPEVRSAAEHARLRAL